MKEKHFREGAIQLDWTVILLYVLGTLLFMLMMVFPDKRDWIHRDSDKKEDTSERKEDKHQDEENDSKKKK